jgi:hypothetical protein
MCIDKHTVYFCFLKDDHMTVSAIDNNFFDWFCVKKSSCALLALPNPKSLSVRSVNRLCSAQVRPWLNINPGTGPETDSKLFTINFCAHALHESSLFRPSLNISPRHWA